MRTTNADEYITGDYTIVIFYAKSQYTTGGARFITIPICPDLLDYECIGAADNFRGKVVRAFFWIMRIWHT